MWNVNVDGAKNVLESCKRQGVENLIYVSSVDTFPDKSFADTRDMAVVH